MIIKWLSEKENPEGIRRWKDFAKIAIVHFYYITENGLVIEYDIEKTAVNINVIK